MLPVDFEGSNTPMVKPQNLSAEECGDLQVRLLKTARGPMFTSCWQPSYEDIHNLEKGKAVIIQMHLNTTIFVDVDTRLQDSPSLYAFNRVVVWLPSMQQINDLKKGTGIYITFLNDRFPVMSVYVNEH